MFYAMHRAYSTVHKQNGLYTDCAQRQKFLQCSERRFWNCLVQSFALRDSRRCRLDNYVFRETDDSGSHYLLILLFHYLYLIDKRQCTRTYLFTHRNIFNIQLVFIIAYSIGMLFMSVYSTAMDTILQCFIVD